MLSRKWPITCEINPADFPVTVTSVRLHFLLRRLTLFSLHYSLLRLFTVFA